MADAAEMLWTVVANVSGGCWTLQSVEWQEAAARWRDYYFAALHADSLRGDVRTLAPEDMHDDQARSDQPQPGISSPDPRGDPCAKFAELWRVGPTMADWVETPPGAVCPRCGYLREEHPPATVSALSHHSVAPSRSAALKAHSYNTPPSLSPMIDQAKERLIHEIRMCLATVRCDSSAPVGDCAEFIDALIAAVSIEGQLAGMKTGEAMRAGLTHTIAQQATRLQALETALNQILAATDGHCERLTTGIGSCFVSGYSPDAEYGADRCCDACIAHHALSGGNPSTTQSSGINRGSAAPKANFQSALPPLQGTTDEPTP